MSSTVAQGERRVSSDGRLDLPVRAADRVRFGPGFGLRYAIFVDTEEEFDWTQPRSRDSVGTSHIKFLPEFQRLADAHGIKPCYLIDYPVAENAESAEAMAAIHAGGNCTIGAQLHAWVNPPFDEELTAANSFPGNLPGVLEFEKLSRLTDMITKAVGKRPTVYRAGRYGIGRNSADVLCRLGYEMDVSVRPQFDYSSEGGPSFMRFDSRPWWAGQDRQLLEMPLSVAYTGWLRSFGKLLFGATGGMVRGMLARSAMVSRVALTPEDMPIDDVRRAIDALVRDGVQCLSFSFHSPSVVPGHTPYVRNSAQLSDFYRWWEKILDHLEQCGASPVSAEEIVEAARASRS